MPPSSEGGLGGVALVGEGLAPPASAVITKHSCNVSLPQSSHRSTTFCPGRKYNLLYALAKNIVAQVEYYDLEAKEDKGEMETLWTQVVFTF